MNTTRNEHTGIKSKTDALSILYSGCNEKPDLMLEYLSVVAGVTATAVMRLLMSSLPHTHAHGEEL